jgi:hypothetical protein
MFRSSSISFFVLFSISSFSSSFSGTMALGSRIVDGTSRDRDCECRCGVTLNTTTLRHLFVGDPEKCAKEECELKFPETCISTQFVEATFVSCLCSCGGHPLVENLFESEDSSECTEAACATQFSEVCPGIASETSANENFATFLDCSCGCQNSTAFSEVEFSKRFFAGSTAACSPRACRTRLSEDACSSDDDVISKYTGPPQEPRMGYDCECGCDESVFKINVGDAAMCVEATCKQKEAFCANAKAVEAKYVDCMCDCCRGSQCPNLVHNLFHSGNMESCTPSACASAFDECPQPLGPSNEENYATYLDCNCQCVGSDEEYSRFFAGSSDTCSRDQCRTWLSLDTCSSGSEIIAYYTGSASGPKTTIKLSREDVVVIAVVLALVAFSLSGYFGYRYYQRRYRGYKWMVMDDETPSEERSNRTLLEFKSLRSQHASKYSTNVEVSDLRVIVPNNDPGYEIQREEFISRKIGLGL